MPVYCTPPKKFNGLLFFLTTKTKSMQQNKCYNDPGETQADEVEGGQEVAGTEEESNEGEKKLTTLLKNRRAGVLPALS